MIVNDESRAAKYAARSGSDEAVAPTEPMQADEGEDLGQLTQMLEESMRNNEEADKPEDIDMEEEGGGEDDDAPRRRRMLRITEKDADDAMDGSSDVKKNNGEGSC